MLAASWTAYSLLAAVLLSASHTDLARREIPNGLTLAASLLALVSAALDRSLLAALWGGLVCGGAMLALWLRGATGGGDVKLAFVVGAFLGWQNGMSAVVWCHLSAAVVIVAGLFIRSLLRQASGDRQIAEPDGPYALPMAPFFALGVLITLWDGGLL